MFSRTATPRKSFGRRKAVRDLRPALGSRTETGTVVAHFEDGSYEIAAARHNFLVEADGATTIIN